MAVEPQRLAVRGARVTDAELVQRFRAGDAEAFAALHERYERGLVRFAQRILRGDAALAEDVVQEAFLRAFRALRRDARPVEPKPWLHQIVRNCCLDELGRIGGPGFGHQPLDLVAEQAAPGVDPAVVSDRRARLRRLVDDLAALPPQQRHALLGLELDGKSHDQLARELGISRGASRALVNRARVNLVAAEDARTTACADVREDLLRARDGQKRATMRTYRHLAGCAGCRSFRAGLTRLTRAQRLLVPVPWLLGGAVAGKVVLVKTGAVKPLAAVGAAGAVAGGVYGLDQVVLGPGDPAPVTAASRVLPGGGIAVGAPLPRDVAIVARRVDPAAPRAARLSCPTGLRVAELLPAPDAPRSYGFAPATVPGRDRVARVVVGAGGADRVVRVLCKRLDRSGSLLAAGAAGTAARPQPGGARAAAAVRVAHVRPARTYLRARPSGAVVGSAFAGQPVVVRARRSGWTLVAADNGAAGWVRSAAVR